MKQEFITWRGKVIIENNTLYIRSYYFFINWQIIRFVLSAIFLAFYITHLFDNPKDAEWNTKTFLWGLAVVAVVLPVFYEALFKYSFSNKIPLDKIVSFEEKKDGPGYKTFVNLKLRSGRIRTIKFRTFEKQHESLISILSQNISQPQIA